jgi:hypothetical protein
MFPTPMNPTERAITKPPDSAALDGGALDREQSLDVQRGGFDPR